MDEQFTVVQERNSAHSWLHTWEPRLKLLAGVLFIVGVVLLQSPDKVALAFGVAILAALTARLPLKFVVGRLLWVLPFLVLMFATITLNSGLNAANLDFASLVTLKALTAITVMTVVLGTQPLADWLKAIAGLRLPPLPVLAFFLACRYLFLFTKDLQTILRATTARGFSPGLNRHTVRVLGEMTGTLLLNALFRADRVYRAMAARGFNGQLPTGRSRRWQVPDLAKTVGGISIAAVLLLWDRGFFW